MVRTYAARRANLSAGSYRLTLHSDEFSPREISLAAVSSSSTLGETADRGGETVGADCGNAQPAPASREPQRKGHKSQRTPSTRRPETSAPPPSARGAIPVAMTEAL